MESFRKFLEISVSSDVELPSVLGGSKRSAMGKVVPKEDDPSYGSMLLVLFPKMIGPIRELLGFEGGFKERPWNLSALGHGAEILSREHPRAFTVFRRVLEQSGQTHDGGPLSVKMSNMEADDLMRFAIKIAEQSEEELSRKEDFLKDEAMKWMAFGNNLTDAVKKSVRSATMQ
jgi:hypothetical protein